MRLILAGLLLASTACFAQVIDRSSQDPFKEPAVSEFLPVEAAYGLEVEVINERQLRLFWRIAPDYYLYQHRFDFTLQDEQGDIGVEAQLPAAITHTDDFFGEVQIYYHGVDMTTGSLARCRARHADRDVPGLRGCRAVLSALHAPFRPQFGDRRGNAGLPCADT